MGHEALSSLLSLARLDCGDSVAALPLSSLPFLTYPASSQATPSSHEQGPSPHCLSKQPVSDLLYPSPEFRVKRPKFCFQSTTFSKSLTLSLSFLCVQ